VIKSLFFLLRIVAAWMLLFLLAAALWSSLPLIGHMEGPIVFASGITLAFVLTGAFSHLRRVRLIAGNIDNGALNNRQRRQVEIPFEAGEAFDLLDAAIRELPRIERVESARDSLQVRAKLATPQPYGERPFGRWNPLEWFGTGRNQIQATVTPRQDSGSVTLICEPESAAWTDWFRVDDGANLENAEAVTRAITRRVAERRRNEKADVAQTATEKELTVAKLSLLHAQVEPHFLYNTLASAQLLTRSDPVRAEEMLGHLIQYLRHSLPRTQDDLSTLGEELERALAYLEILKIRMGPRLSVQLDVPEALRATALPPMMLQTLVENSIKHGFSRKVGGGRITLRSFRQNGHAIIEVEDDGLGMTREQLNTALTDGIGLSNVNERLGVIYGAAYQVQLTSVPGVGTVIRLEIPELMSAERITA